MRSIVVFGLLGGLLAGCAADTGQDVSFTAKSPADAKAGSSTAAASAPHRLSQVAAQPDRGSLLAYGHAGRVQRGATTWYPVQLSEEHALNSIASGEMQLTSPDGAPIRLRYQRHYEHADGSWSWVGHPVGARPGVQAVLTFGEKAVFGMIPNGNGEPLELTTAAGRTWMLDTDQRKLLLQSAAAAPHASEPDFLPTPAALAAAVTRQGAAKTPKAAAGGVRVLAADSGTATVDIVIGYTAGFASRLGGQSQALTRLDQMVALANQAYQNSQVNGQLRLVKAVQVDYPDDTANRTTLFELTGAQCSGSGNPDQHLPEGGVACTALERPAALQPLVDARDEEGADLVALVRNLNFPQNGSCGISWLLGGGQTAIDANSANFAFSVISDSNGNQFPSNSNTCRNDTLAHETGHNMGLQHDLATARGNDDTDGDGDLLDTDEFGRFPYSFGYSTGADSGNFYTVMANRQTGQTGYLVFSNPRVTFCGGLACGVNDQSDNARTLEQTMPIVAAFRSPESPRSDFDGDGQSDILWRNNGTGANAIWRSANASASIAVAAVPTSWKAVGIGDFDGDGRADLLWRNASTGVNAIWRSGDVANSQPVTRVANLSFVVAGVGDFDGDGQADILWRNNKTGENAIWRSANSGAATSVPTVAVSWKVVGVGDFDGDGQDDILWRNGSNGVNAIWRSGNFATSQAVATVSNLSFEVVGVADFDGDGRDDILWRNNKTGANAIWRAANAATPQSVTGVTNVAWKVAAVGDYNGDARADILWRNGSTGANALWSAANAGSPLAVAGVTNLAWGVVF